MRPASGNATVIRCPELNSTITGGRIGVIPAGSHPIFLEPAMCPDLIDILQPLEYLLLKRTCQRPGMGIEHSRCELRKLDIILFMVEFGTVGFLLPRDGWTQ